MHPAVRQRPRPTLRWPRFSALRRHAASRTWCSVGSCEVHVYNNLLMWAGLIAVCSPAARLWLNPPYSCYLCTCNHLHVCIRCCPGQDAGGSRPVHCTGALHTFVVLAMPAAAQVRCTKHAQSVRVLACRPATYVLSPIVRFGPNSTMLTMATMVQP